MFDTKIGKYDCAVHLSPKKQEGLPLILYLHGAGVREEGTLLSLKTSKMLRCLEENPEYPAVVVAPLLGDKQNFWIAELPFLRELLDKATALYACNPQRVFVTGASMGGFGTWYLAQRYPDRFAGIAPVCGGGMPWCAGVLKMPIRAFHGTEDTVVDVRESIDMVRKAQEGGNKDVVLTLYPGVGHNAWDFAYDRNLFDWFLR